MPPPATTRPQAQPNANPTAPAIARTSGTATAEPCVTVRTDAARRSRPAEALSEVEIACGVAVAEYMERNEFPSGPELAALVTEGAGFDLHRTTAWRALKAARKRIEDYAALQDCEKPG